MSTVLNSLVSSISFLAGGDFSAAAVMQRNFSAAAVMQRIVARTASRLRANGERLFRDTYGVTRFSLQQKGLEADEITGAIGSNANVSLLSPTVAEAEPLDIMSPASVTFTFRRAPAAAHPVFAGGITQLAGWAPGTFGGDCFESINSMVADKAPTVQHRALYSGAGPGPLARNPECVLPLSVDVSCYSTWNTFNGQSRAGTLLTPRHVLCAAHYILPIGTVLHFQGNDGSHHTRQVVSFKKDEEVGHDICIALLDSDLPASVKPAEILPADWRTRISDVAFLPQLNLNKPDYIGVSVVGPHAYSTGAVTWSFFNPAGGAGPALPGVSTMEGWEQQAAWHLPAVGGDSGSPAFLYCAGRLILVSHYYSRMSGPHLANLAALLQDWIDELDVAAGNSPPVALTRADLSAFPQY